MWQHFEFFSPLCHLWDNKFTGFWGQLRTQGQPVKILVGVIETLLVHKPLCRQVFPTCRFNFAPSRLNPSCIFKSFEKQTNKQKIYCNNVWLPQLSEPIRILGKWVSKIIFFLFFKVFYLNFNTRVIFNTENH